MHCAKPPVPIAGAPRCSEDEGEFGEGRSNTPGLGRLDAQLVVPSAEVLDEGMTGDHDPRRAVRLEAAHGTEACLQPAVIGLDALLACGPTLWKAPGSSSSMTPT